MANFYQKLLKKGIDLSPLGVERHADNITYFCTPKGASIIGWAGVDGIHYCFIRGFGEMVFAVNPVNSYPDYVHPLAENFEDFLKLLLACGDAAALEQAWMWNQKQFDSFLEENLPEQSQQAVLTEIANKLNLAPMDEPWQYMKTLQASFDYRKIRYTEDLSDPEMNIHAEKITPDWKVFFEGNFWGHSGKDHAGKEIRMGKEFQWAGFQWSIPAIYSCSKGLVIEFCRKIDSAQIVAFMERWNLNPESDGERQFSHAQQMEIDRDNPLCFDFSSIITLNGKELRPSHGCGLSYNPCVPEAVMDQMEAKWVVGHYGLDPDYGWEIYRSAYPWKTKRKPQIHTLSVSMEQQKIPMPVLHFHVEQSGKQISFTFPQTGMEHRLTVQDYEPQELSEKNFGHSPDMEYPRHFVAMSYTIEPEIEAGALTISDTADSDQPRRVHSDPLAPTAKTDVCCIGIIGGADDPTVISLSRSSGGRCQSVCSSLHFEPIADVEWQMTFYEKRYSDYEVELM